MKCGPTGLKSRHQLGCLSAGQGETSSSFFPASEASKRAIGEPIYLLSSASAITSSLTLLPASSAFKDPFN